MTTLHAYFHQRNQQAFQRLLDPARSQHSHSGGPSTSGGKSWSRPSPLSSALSLDVNARDHLGRTVLHLAASCRDASAPEYVRMLLSHPAIHVNLPDTESHWTALHRALYHGNIATVLLLLQRADIDTSVRDIEGYTPFDLYNSTIEGTMPDHRADRGEELYTWGSNRNAALGVGDADDRAVPELISLRVSTVPDNETLDARFTPIRARQIAMSRLHTVIVTDEPRGNLRICGFGSGGRLGPGQHTQYKPVPLTGFSYTVTVVAVGQDHTLVLTRSGEVYSWGLNRFAQLGFIVETATGARAEEPIQSTPRKIAGAIRNRQIVGVAACKTASVCWTDDEIFTWGTNNGQLGYDRAAQPIQIVPRVVTKISKPVLSVSITDTALACLLDSQEVVCLWNDGHFKVNFPAYSFPSEFVAYRPPQAANRSNASIGKITSCEDTFAALSSSGEVFTFSLPAPPEGGAGTSTKTRFSVQPQRVWALRKRFSAVRDVALGVDGSIIICTESGHVFVRSRNLKAGQGSNAKAFKFQRIPYIQRITRVCANATGAFAALRADWVPEEVKIVGNQIPQDLASIQPYFNMNLDSPDENVITPSTMLPSSSPSSPVEAGPESDEEDEDAYVLDDIKQLKALCSIILRLRQARKETNRGSVLDPRNMPFDADLIVRVQSNGIEVPAHRPVLAARSHVLYRILSEGNTVRDPKSNISVQGHLSKSAGQKYTQVTFAGCHPLSVLIILVYLYSDEPLAVWDHRIGHAIQRHLDQLKVKPPQVKSEIQALASILELSALSNVLDAPVKRSPKPSLASDLQQLFAASQNEGSGARARRPFAPDVVLQLAEREVYCHSIILRSRSPFFAAFFGDKDWTAKRWTPEGSIIVNLKHMKWRAMEPVLKYMCCGEDKEIFEIVEDVRSVDELIDLMFDVMAIANELHIDRLVLVCSWVIMKRVWINNVCSVLTDATYYHVKPLIRLLQQYMTINMELFLEGRMFEDPAPDLIRQLSTFIHTHQAEKYPISRSTRIIDKAMEVWGEWLALQDIPQPIVPSFRPGAFKDSPKLSPPGPSKRANRQSAPNSPMLRPTVSSRPVTITDDEVFIMDPETPALPPPVSAPGSLSRIPSDSETPPRAIAGWKTITFAPKADMKAIMAETSTSKTVSPSKPVLATASRPQEPMRRTPPHTKSEPLAKGGSATASGSWRVPQPSTNVNGSPGVPSVVPEKDPNAAATPGTSSAATGTGASRSQPTTPRKPTAPGLGPVFTPTKQSPVSATSSIRRTSSGNVWTPSPVQPIVQPSSTASASAMSFAAIQLAQAEQDAVPTKQDKRSLVEIQEEERERQAEEDFLRWWAAEEERVRAEEAAATTLLVEAPKKPRKSRLGQKGKSTGPSASGGDSQKGGAKAAAASDAPKLLRENSSQGRPTAQGQGQAGKPPRRRRHAQGSAREDSSKADAQ